MKCEFEPELSSEVGKIVQCPSCGHIVILGLNHGDFDNPHSPISEDELTKLSLEHDQTKLKDSA
jgi:hypothetical protein